MQKLRLKIQVKIVDLSRKRCSKGDKVMKKGFIFASESVFHSSLPFHYLTKFIGLGFYKFNVDGQPFEIHIGHKISFILTVVSWTATTIFNLAVSFEKYFDGSQVDSDFLDKVSFFEMLMEMTFGLLLIIYNQKNVKHIHKLLVSMNNFDETLKEFKWRFLILNSWRYFLVVVGTAVYIIAAIFIHRVQTTKLDLFEFFELMVFTTNLLLFTAVLCQFTVSVLGIKTRLYVLFRNVQ